jgi:hypothetical protein
MATQTQTFLRSRGAREISPAKRLRLRGDRAFRITARSPHVTTTATGIRHGPTRYLLLVGRRGAKGPAPTKLAAAASSFRPR